VELTKEESLRMAIDIFYSIENFERYENDFPIIILFLVDYLSWSSKEPE